MRTQRAIVRFARRTNPEWRRSCGISIALAGFVFVMVAAVDHPSLPQPARAATSIHNADTVTIETTPERGSQVVTDVAATVGSNRERDAAGPRECQSNLGVVEQCTFH
jgi:hypothetical protein